MTFVTPPLENTRFSPFFDFTVLRPPGIGSGPSFFTLALLFALLFSAGKGHDIAHAGKHHARAVGIGLDRLARGDAREHQHRGHTALHTGDHVGVHAVADHDGFAGVAVELFESRAHHQRVGLAAEVCLRTRRHLNGRNERAAGGRDAVFDGAGHVRIRANELCALPDEVRRLRQRIERIRPPLAHDHIVGVHIVHRDARVVERVQKPCLADGEDRAPRRLIAQEGRRCERARIKVLLGHVEPHTLKLLVQFARRIAAVVRQEKVLLLFVVQPLDELRHARQHAVAVVDDAVHIADKALFSIKFL